jgi:hypothetical protein
LIDDAQLVALEIPIARDDVPDVLRAVVRDEHGVHLDVSFELLPREVSQRSPVLLLHRIEERQVRHRRDAHRHRAARRDRQQTR